jgi:outer membrane receptor for ferrienterochelin and colicins
VKIGIQNILNSYQRDFDNGIGRDASYVYGPMRPATLMLSFKLGSSKP